MLTYLEFKKLTLDRFMELLGEEFSDYRLNLRKIVKVNRQLDGLTLEQPDMEGTQISPTVYVDDLYKDYLSTGNELDAIEKGVVIMRTALRRVNDMCPKLDYKNVKDKIVFQLINTDNNRSLLADVPHRAFMDLSLIYRWIVNADDQGISSVIIHNELAEGMGLNEEQLHELAMENTRRILEPKISDLEDIMNDLFMKGRIEPEEMESYLDRAAIDRSFFIISNATGFIGAASMVYEDVLESVGQLIGSDFYILPSSIHEVIAVAACKGSDPDALIELVEGVNKTELEAEEILSDSVYYYSLSDKALTSFTANKY